MQRLPPLDLLRTFVEVARSRSMSRAASALFITQSAVSRQIRQLEEQLGVPLFIRHARGIELSRAGQQLLPSVEQAFDVLQQAVAGLSTRPADLKIKLPPTLALRWFLPRLGDFQSQHPEVEVRMSTASFNHVNFEREDFDCAIVFGKRAPTDAFVQPLFEERLLPVCSPATAARLLTPADLAHEPLIHLSHDHGDWRAWLALAQVSHPNLAAGPSFEVIDMAVSVAEQGVGVALADPILVTNDLRTGRLIAPFPDMALANGDHYWFICPRSRRHEAPIEALQAWLLSQIAASGI